MYLFRSFTCVQPDSKKLSLQNAIDNLIGLFKQKMKETSLQKHSSVGKQKLKKNIIGKLINSELITSSHSLLQKVAEANYFF